tara:strand:+ start:448 stop:618 length:171 start_codon:yes stop_codon:yes gene_type:complete
MPKAQWFKTKVRNVVDVFKHCDRTLPPTHPNGLWLRFNVVMLERAWEQALPKALAP